MKDDREPAVKRSTAARPTKRAASRAETAAEGEVAKPARKRVNGKTQTEATTSRKTSSKRGSSSTAAPAASTAASETTVKRRSRPPVAAQNAGQAAETLAPPTPEERHRMIERIAYFRAEWRGWTPGAELDDWLHAEREVDAMLSGRRET